MMSYPGSTTQTVYQHNGKTITKEEYERILNKAKADGSITPEQHSTIMNQLARNEYDRAYNAAKTANENRYGEIKGSYDDLLNAGWQVYGDLYNKTLGNYGALYQAGMDYVDRQGAQERQDIQDSWRKQGAEAQQNLVSRGLAGTTIPNTVNQAVTRNTNQDLGRMNDRLNMQRAAVNQNIGGAAAGALHNVGQNQINQGAGTAQNKLNFMERRDDTYPDVNLYAQLAQQYGAAGGGTRTPITQHYPTQSYQPAPQQQYAPAQPQTFQWLNQSPGGIIPYKGGAGGGNSTPQQPLPGNYVMGNANVGGGISTTPTGGEGYGEGYIIKDGVKYDANGPRLRQRR
jgi:hypothetical protein